MTKEEIAIAQRVIETAKRMFDDLEQIQAARVKLTTAKVSFADWNTAEQLLSADLLTQVLRLGMQAVVDAHEKQLALIRLPDTLERTE